MAGAFSWPTLSSASPVKGVRDWYGVDHLLQIKWWRDWIYTGARSIILLFTLGYVFVLVRFVSR